MPAWSQQRRADQSDTAAAAADPLALAKQQARDIDDAHSTVRDSILRIIAERQKTIDSTAAEREKAAQPKRARVAAASPTDGDDIQSACAAVESDLAPESDDNSERDEAIAMGAAILDAESEDEEAMEEGEEQLRLPEGVLEEDREQFEDLFG